MIKPIRWCAIFLLAMGFCAQAADFPVRPVRIMVPSTPGGALDVLARLLSPRLTQIWGQQIVIDYRAGAGGIIGTDLVAKSTPDGYNLLIVTTGFVTNTFFHEKLPYSPQRDFTPITIVGFTPNVLVAHPSLAVHTVAELISLAKQKPGQLTFGSSGAGSSGHLAMVLLARMGSIELTHVPYKGAGAATTAVVAGETPLLVTAVGAAQPHIKANRLRAIAVTGSKRSSALPDVPAIAESGLKNYSVEAWYGILGPANMPKPLVSRIYNDIRAVINNPEAATQISAAGFELVGMPPDKYAAYLVSDFKTWGDLIKSAGLRAE